MLMKRILTALILIPITLAALFYLSPPMFYLFTGIIALGAAWEWSNLMGVTTLKGKIIYLLITAIIFAWLLKISVFAVFIVAFFWWLIAAFLVFTYPRHGGLWATSVFMRGVMGLFVIVPCMAAINFMRNQSDGIYALLFLFVLVWSADSAAYFTGKKWGKRKLAASVSPGKTWEGVFGALIFSALITLCTLWMINIPYSLWPWALILSLIAVLFSIVGDLFESMMKREAGVKDSGNLLPGHGGLLDRIDSLTAAAPIFVLGGILLGMYLE